MKKIFALLLISLLLFPSVVSVYAANGKVIYDGVAQEFVFKPGSEQSLTDLFPDFKGVMPGDSLTQKITVRNESSKKVKVKIYIRSLGAHEDSVEFLSQLSLKVSKSADNKMAYMFDAAASEAAQLKDWVYLGTLYSGGEVNLNVELEVPVTLGNEFQNKVGYLDWEFKVEEYPVEGTDPVPPPTGDSTHFMLWTLLMCASVFFIIILLVRKKKERRQDEEAEEI